MNHELLKALCIVAKANGCMWVAQDVSNAVNLFDVKPEKHKDFWQAGMYLLADEYLCIGASEIGYCDNWQESLVNVDEYLGVNK